jgi:polyphosphate kinase 2 (PPK2 family)
VREPERTGHAATTTTATTKWAEEEEDEKNSARHTSQRATVQHEADNRGKETNADDVEQKRSEHRTLILVENEDEAGEG